MKASIASRVRKLEQSVRATETPSYIAVATEEELQEALQELQAPVKVYIGGFSPDDWDRDYEQV